MKKKIFITLGILLAIYLAGGIYLYFYQSSFLYYPNKQDFNSCKSFASAEKVDWHGTRMYVKKSSANWIVFYHGNGGSACNRSFFAPLFERTGYSYIFVEYAGYSNDARQPSENLLTGDARNALDYLNTQKPAAVTVMGESLGTALAVYQAHLSHPDKLILISPLNNLPAVAARNFPSNLYPVKLLLKDRYPSDVWITETAKSVTILHGSKDSFIPIALARALFDEIKVPNKTFVEIPGSDHNDMYKHPETAAALEAALR